MNRKEIRELINEQKAEMAKFPRMYSNTTSKTQRSQNLNPKTHLGTNFE